MSEQNKQVVRRMYEVINGRNLALATELVTEDVVYHDAPPGLPPGREGYLAFTQLFLDAFPDLQLTVEDLLAEGDRVAARVRGRGTHQGELMGIAPTGRRFEAAGITIIRLQDGKIAEEWEQIDMLGILQQLGVIPAPENATSEQADGTEATEAVSDGYAAP